MFQKSVTGFRWKSQIAVWQQVDLLLFAIPVSLTLFGGVIIRSAELNQGLTDWWQHWLVGAIGLVIAMFIARSRYENLLQWHWIIYGLTNLSLLAVIVIGSSAKGAQRWIGIAGFNLQPSEFAKVGLIITLAAILHTRTASTLPDFGKALAITAVPWLLVFIQPDLGTSLVFGAITLGMLYWANANPGWLLLLVSPIVSAILFNVFLDSWIFLDTDSWIIGVWAVIVAAVAWFSLPWSWYGAVGAVIANLVSGELGHIFWNLLKEYQKNRLVLFLDPAKDPLGGGYHLIQSRIAIGAGGIWGKGLNQGSQTQLNFIPEQHTDFIFSAIGEELGFIGGLVLLLVFWLLCWRLIMIAQTSKENFGSLLAIGVLSMIVFQVIINIGMTIGLAPVTGIPLPWISYGRSALLTNFIAVGIVESVANYRHRLKF
jgi:rod shape determining protein RodA